MIFTYQQLKITPATNGQAIKVPLINFMLGYTRTDVYIFIKERYNI